MKKFLQEFKTFALKGNVMDMAVGVIIGAAFQAIVTALTSDFINPLIAALTGGVNVDENGNPVYVGGKFVVNGVEFNYGDFASAVINFLIMALILFLLLKAVNKLMNMGKKPTAPGAPTTKICPFCKSTIDIAAVKCPHCTSDIPEEEKTEEAKA